jgi:hypothetical protein
VIFLSTKEKTRGEVISTALYVLAIFIPDSAPARNPFDTQRLGFSGSEAHSWECNGWAILNSLSGCGLGSPFVLHFEEFLWREEKSVDSRFSVFE